MGLFNNKYKICVNETTKRVIENLVLTGDKNIDKTLATRKIDFYNKVLRQTLEELKCPNIEKYQEMFKKSIEDYVINYQKPNENKEKKLYETYKNKMIELLDGKEPNNKIEKQLESIIKDAKKNISDKSLIIMLENQKERCKKELMYNETIRTTEKIEGRLNDTNNLNGKRTMDSLNKKEIDLMLSERNNNKKPTGKGSK